MPRAARCEKSWSEGVKVHASDHVWKERRSVSTLVTSDYRFRDEGMSGVERRCL
jgi:hypothetical protein